MYVINILKNLGFEQECFNLDNAEYGQLYYSGSCGINPEDPRIIDIFKENLAVDCDDYFNSFVSTMNSNLEVINAFEYVSTPNGRVLKYKGNSLNIDNSPLKNYLSDGKVVNETFYSEFMNELHRICPSVDCTSIVYSIRYAALYHNFEANRGKIIISLFKDLSDELGKYGDVADQLLARAKEQGIYLSSEDISAVPEDILNYSPILHKTCQTFADTALFIAQDQRGTSLFNVLNSELNAKNNFSVKLRELTELRKADPSKTAYSQAQSFCIRYNRLKRIRKALDSYCEKYQRQLDQLEQSKPQK